MASKQTSREKRIGANPKRSELQKAGAAFVDHLGKAAVEKLKTRLGLNTEVKYVDTAGAVTSTSTLSAALNTFTTAIPQGLTDNTREGSSVRATRHSWKFNVNNGAANAVGYTYTRLIGVRWNPTVGTNCDTNYADVLEASGNGNSLYTYDPSYGRNIIFDRTFTLGATGNGAQPNVYTFEFDYAPSDLHLRWTTGDTAGTLANSIGSVICWYVITNTATASNFPFVNYYQRVEYVDN